MRKLLIGVGVVAIAYYLYQMYNKKNEVVVDPPIKTGDAIDLAIKEAQKPKPRKFNIIDDNRQVFRSMRGNFNAEESATVAPSINAKIGIF
jgi:hypothetical protein|tara:strand:- start:585 stop:857 length:273 start_codon:yes stop_codon:yes gene_type:complete